MRKSYKVLKLHNLYYTKRQIRLKIYTNLYEVGEWKL